ncbi:MAG: phosphohydrolase, partial [Muribaculaceae bacterium]|nr:phosphohydrolase [Muribaculaceae bacterium]
RAEAHIIEKYGENGYLRLWIPESPNAARMAELRALIADTNRLRECLNHILAEESARQNQ